MLNLKYHIVSLAAVFCALAIGIFVGSNLVGNDLFVDQQKQLVSRLEQEFNLLREQNRQTQDELTVFKNTTDDYRLFCEQTFPLIISGKLDQKSFAVIELSPSDATEKVIKTINDAGANVAYSAAFNWEAPPDWSILLSPDEQGPLTNKENYIRLFNQIEGFLISGHDTPALSELRQNGFLVVDGVPGKAVDGVILLEGSNEDRSEIFNNFDLLLADAYIEAGENVIIAESEDVLFSSLETFKLKSVTTIDNIDSTIGLTSLVFSLQGKSGHYGTGNTAERLIPELKTN